MPSARAPGDLEYPMPASALMNVMVAAARKAGRSLARDFGEVEQLQVSIKGPGNFVSAADHRAEEILYRELLKARPGYGFLMEEGGEVEGPDKTHRWIIDPLDGTTNFLHGIPLFAISVALEREGQIVAADYAMNRHLKKPPDFARVRISNSPLSRNIPPQPTQWSTLICPMATSFISDPHRGHMILATVLLLRCASSSARLLASHSASF